jgi:hypothetical protein
MRYRPQKCAAPTTFVTLLAPKLRMHLWLAWHVISV